MKLIKKIAEKGQREQADSYFNPRLYGRKALTKNTIGYYKHQRRKKIIMKKSTILCSALILISFLIITGCEREQISQKPSTGAIKVNARLVGIDSTSNARTEDKVLFVNIKN